MSSSDRNSTIRESSNETDGLGLRISMPNDENTLGPPALETPPNDMSISFLRDTCLSPCHEKKRKREKMISSFREEEEEEEEALREMMQVFGLTRVTALSRRRDCSNNKMDNLWTRRKRTALSESKGDIQALSVSVVNNVESKMMQERPSNGRNRRRLHSSGSFRYV